MKAKPEKGSKILLVEDEESLAIGLEFNLREEGYEVDWARDGKIAIEKFNTIEYDLIILDIMLPYFDGFEIAQMIREKSARLPILILTARRETIDKLRGLKLGADDYLTKPFELEELLLRIEGMLKRKSWYRSAYEPDVSHVRFGPNEVDFTTYRCHRGDQEFQLTYMEAMILKYLVENKNRIVSRKELLKNVWHLSDDIETRTIDNFIVRLRKYFETDPAQPKYFLSVRSSGYKFTDAE
ncbi:response regulator transcription factor [candidate division KSB1 bacterium]|nr:response regulator transcription factor [candidate division KSB1 bacterium]